MWNFITDDTCRKHAEAEQVGYPAECFIAMKDNRAVKTIQRTLDIYSKHEMNVYAGNTTYYLLLSFVPLMMMVISVVNELPWFSVTDLTNLIMRIIPDIPQIRFTLTQILTNVNRQSGSLVFLFGITSLWSGSNGITALMIGLEKINHTQKAFLFDKVKAIFYAILFCLLIPSMLPPFIDSYSDSERTASKRGFLQFLRAGSFLI